MSDTNRVQRWREAKRQHGLKHVSIWLTSEEEMRLKDLAMQWRCSPSQVVQQALSHIGSPTAQDICSPTDTYLTRQLIQEGIAEVQAALPTLVNQLIREEFARLQATLAPVTAGVTVTAPETPHGTAIADVSPVSEPVTVIRNSNVTETASLSEAENPPPGVETLAMAPPASTAAPRDQERAYGAYTAAVFVALTHRQQATPAELAQALGDGTRAGTKAVWQALQRLVQRGEVIREGPQYRPQRQGAPA